MNLRTAFLILSFGSPAPAFLACTTETIVTQPAPAASNTGATEPTPLDTADADAKPDAAEAGVDAAPPAATWIPGQEGKSCASACTAAGKTCAVACTDHKSCGGHDGVPAPYAGYACYYHESKSGGSSFRSNEGRSLATCDAVATNTWSLYGTPYQIGDYLGGNPVSCCCR